MQAIVHAFFLFGIMVDSQSCKALLDGHQERINRLSHMVNHPFYWGIRGTLGSIPPLVEEGKDWVTDK